MNPQRAPAGRATRAATRHEVDLQLEHVVEIERYVLGAILNDSTGLQIQIASAELRPEDFVTKPHQFIFTVMQYLQVKGESIGRATVYVELERHQWHKTIGDFSYLADLDTGMPELIDLGSWAKIIRDKSIARRVAQASQNLLIGRISRSEMLGQVQYVTELLSRDDADPRIIRSVDELESVFSECEPLEYLIEPELPARTVVYLAGTSASGKSTLSCAWARDVVRKGHAALLLDRDKNPRERIRERMERLGVSSNPLLNVWDCQQRMDAPQPDSPIITDWVSRMMEKTGKGPLVLVDSLVSFLLEGQDENSSVHMRALFNRCRVLTRLGATVVLIHHIGLAGTEARFLTLAY